ncbi:phytanoyl-CoA dioxygenase family protein [Paenibacillus whitsoniae]|uniref:Phytanoyl-CoA dioxygenase family protein n=1 Tax=Paenibacillus whitsoniae TaxID=2496558 RepID=A0A430JG00_9BACL|nr:phytanoyl-CoA dioxygenase family protein [Paenibacillus whitsoniae]RTE09940.1 phytanoyl-CoA dioxygenase family protein [Paenibacillus whitsoniae]
MTYHVTDEQIAFYHNQGFVQLDNVLTPAQIEELTYYLNDVMLDQALPDGGASDDFYRILNSRMNTWKDSAGMAKYSLSPYLADIALKLAQTDGIRFFHDQAFWKMPGDSKPTPWHQDATYFPMKEPDVLTMWIPLDDVDENNGCLSFVPNSHRVGKLTNVDFVNPIDIFELAREANPHTEMRQPVIVPLHKGSCTVHHGLTFHYAYANKTDKPRRVLTIVYMSARATFNGRSNHELTRELGLQDGEPLQGRLFPVLAARV